MHFWRSNDPRIPIPGRQRQSWLPPVEAAVAMRLAGLALLATLILSADSQPYESLRMGSVVSTTAFPARPDEYGSVLQFIQPAVLPATAADSSAWYDCDLCSLSCDSVELNLSATAAISSDCQHDYEFGRLVSLDVASMNIDEAWTDATKEELSRVLPNEVTPAGVANTALRTRHGLSS